MVRSSSLKGMETSDYTLVVCWPPSLPTTSHRESLVPWFMDAREVENKVQLGSHVLLGYYPITEGERFGLSASNLLQYETSFSLSFN